MTLLNPPREQRDGCRKQAVYPENGKAGKAEIIHSENGKAGSAETIHSENGKANRAEIIHSENGSVASNVSGTDRPAEIHPVRTLSWRVTEPDSGQSIEQFLRAMGCSRHVLTHLKRTANGICRNGLWAYANQRVFAGDEIVIRLTEERSSETIVPVPLPLSVVYEDEDLLVINKPSDMPVHPSIHNYTNTLANAVVWHSLSQGRPFVFRCVNRLDRDTSGILLVAKNRFSSTRLSAQSAGRDIEREYLAVAEGILPDAGTIDAPIARCPSSAIMRCVDRERGERAVTHYRRLALFRKKPELPEKGLPEYVSLAAVRLETGRTHQIRVHMKSIGHPLPGDFLYHPDSVCRLAARQMLHAYRLSFRHPVSGQPLTFRCGMPQDMQALLQAYEFRHCGGGSEIPDGIDPEGRF